jgi:hypothetical protein
LFVSLYIKKSEKENRVIVEFEFDEWLNDDLYVFNLSNVSSYSSRFGEDWFHVKFVFSHIMFLA